MSDHTSPDVYDLFSDYLPAEPAAFAPPFGNPTVRFPTHQLTTTAVRYEAYPSTPTRINPEVERIRRYMEDDLRKWGRLPSPPQPATLTERLQAVGIRALSDDEVIDHGDYVELKEYPRGEVALTVEWDVVMAQVEGLELSLRDDPFHRFRESSQPCCVYIGKPLRMAGWHRVVFAPEYGVNETDSYLYFSVGPAPLRKQSVFVASRSNVRSGFNGRATTGVTTYRDVPVVGNLTTSGKVITRVHFKDVPPAARREWLIHALSVRQMNAAGSAYRNIQDRVDAIDLIRSKATAHTERGEEQPVATGFLPRPRIVYKGATYTPGSASSFLRDRAIMKTTGERLATIVNGQDYSPDDFTEDVGDLSTYSLANRLRNQIVEVWNEESNPEWTVTDCEHITYSDDTTTVSNGDTMCSDCLNEDYVYCEDSEEYHHHNDAYEHSDGCWRTYEEEDDYDDDDDDDYEYPSQARVRGYNTNVLDYYGRDTSITPTSYGEFLMGIELEVVPTSQRVSAATATHDSLCEGYAIMKDDSSLNSGGFEIVTAPRGMAEHVRRFKAWEPHENLRAWDTGCCGLHTHISSQAFTAVTLGKFVEFINADANRKLIKRIAGRHPLDDAQSRQFCRREGDMFEANPKKTMEHKSTSRYTMVNTVNLSRHEARRLGLRNWDDYPNTHINTVELRIFKASLNKNRLLAQIEFAHAAVNFCRWSSMRQLDEKHFLEWLRTVAGLYPHLAKWYGVKANRKTVAICPKVLASSEV